MTSVTYLGPGDGRCCAISLDQRQSRIGSHRLKGWDYSARGWYFVTVCTRHKECSLGQVVNGEFQASVVGSIAQAHLLGIPSHYCNVTIDQFVVMPNHVHAIVVIEGLHAFSPGLGVIQHPASKTFPHCFPRAGSLSAIVRSYKSGVSRECRLRGLEFAWQAGFYDRVLRNNREVDVVRTYIDHNPGNWLIHGDDL